MQIYAHQKVKVLDGDHKTRKRRNKVPTSTKKSMQPSEAMWAVG